MEGAAAQVAEGAAAQVAEGDAGMASVPLRRLAERIAARERLRADEEEDEREWTRHGDAYFIRFPEGHLCKLRHRGRWTLVLVWPDRRMRVLIRGSRKSIERYAQEVLCHGPPGGPDYEGGELEWRASDDDTTLRAATIGGELRLMPWHDGQDLLVLVQNDHGAAVLGRGRREVLQRTAEDLLDERGADTLHLRLGDVRINLRGLGSASTVGYVDLHHGGQLVLGPTGDGDFALLYQLGEYTREVGVYTLAQVRRGDLGRAFAWASNPWVAEPPRPEVRVPRASDVAPGAQPEVATPTPELARATAEVAIPTRPPEGAPPSGSTIPSPGISTSTSTGEPPGPPMSSAKAAMFPQETAPCLSAPDLRLVERHLTLDEVPTGGGAALVPRLLHGVYRLIASGRDDLLLRAEVLRTLLARRFRIHFDCGPRTFRRALLAVAAHTPLLRKVGHRWHLGIGALQRQGSALLCWIRTVTPPDTDDAGGGSHETDPETDRGATAHGAAPEVPVERRAAQDTPPVIADPGVHASVERTGSHERSGSPVPSDHDCRLQAPEVRVDESEVGTPRVPADHIVDVRCPDPPATTNPVADHARVPASRSAALADHANLHLRQEDPEPDRRAYAGATAPAPDLESPPPRWGYQRRLRTDGKPTVWRRKWEPLPAEQCASQFSGKKGRGPPRKR